MSQLVENKGFISPPDGYVVVLMAYLPTSKYAIENTLFEKKIRTYASQIHIQI